MLEAEPSEVAVAVVNFKRPFGDATAFEHDMEYILGLPPAADEEERMEWLDSLYRELWPALQVFVANADMRLFQTPE
jgi:hypothetical protein